MRYLALALAMSACADEPTQGHADDCASAWTTWCDAVFECVGGVFSIGTAPDAFTATDVVDCHQKVLTQTTVPFGDVTYIFGCADVTAPGYAACTGTAASLVCPNGPSSDLIMPTIEACQLP